MIQYWAICKICNEESFINPGCDNPPHCPECFSVDEMEELETE